jgi:hypothetical protein
MGADYRILGRDSTMRVTQDGILLAETTALKVWDFKPVVSLISEGFIGEAAKRHREIFDEVAVTYTVEPEGKEILHMQYAVYQRARSGQANDLQINVGFRLLFPSGSIVKLTIPDLRFDDIGNLSNPGREAFNTMTFSAKSDRYIPSFT